MVKILHKVKKEMKQKSFDMMSRRDAEGAEID
jgi:hypothetical protein